MGATGKAPVGKYVVIQMRTNGVLNLADVKVKCPAPPCTSVTEANVQLSTDHSSRRYLGKNCVDGDPSTFCHNKGSEQNPFLVLEYDSPVSVPEVVVTNRNMYGERTKNMFVTVTNKKPVKGKIAEGEILGSFTGPGTNGQVITIKATGKAPVGKYVVIQMRTKGVLSLADVKVECPGPPPCTSVTEANVQ